MTRLSCGSCGAKLELTEDVDRFACAHCGTEWLVNRGGGIVSLKAVEEGIVAIRQDTGLMASGEKIRVLKEKVSELEEDLQHLHRQREALTQGEPASPVSLPMGCGIALALVALVSVGGVVALMFDIVAVAVAAALILDGSQRRKSDIQARLGKIEDEARTIRCEIDGYDTRIEELERRRLSAAVGD